MKRLLDTATVINDATADSAAKDAGLTEGANVAVLVAMGVELDYINTVDV